MWICDRRDLGLHESHFRFGGSRHLRVQNLQNCELGRKRLTRTVALDTMTEREERRHGDEALRDLWRDEAHHRVLLARSGVSAQWETEQNSDVFVQDLQEGVRGISVSQAAPGRARGDEVVRWLSA